MKRDSLGRSRQPSQGGAGPKHIPNQTHGALTGPLCDVPQDLGDIARSFWVDAAEAMEKLGILESADAHILRISAETFERMQLAKQEVERDGGTILEDGKMKRHPALVTLEKSAILMRSLLSDIGLTPSARAKFGTQTQDDAFDALFAETNPSRFGN